MNKKTVFLSGVLAATCAMFLFSTIVRAEIVTAESGDNMWSWVAYNDGAGRPNSNGLRLINEEDNPDPTDKIWKAIFIIQDINHKLSEQTSGVAGNQIRAIYDPNLIVAGKDYWLPNSEFINNVLSQYGSGDQYAMRGDSDYDSNIDAILKDPDFLELYADQTGRDKWEVFDAMGVPIDKLLKDIKTIASDISGKWDTNLGQMTLNKKGDSITGTYSSTKISSIVDTGTITGKIKGRTFTGFWIKTKSATKCQSKKNGSYYWGGIKFKFSEAFTRFNGSWSYCAGGGGGSWNGSRSSK